VGQVVVDKNQWWFLQWLGKSTNKEKK